MYVCEVMSAGTDILKDRQAEGNKKRKWINNRFQISVRSDVIFIINHVADLLLRTKTGKCCRQAKHGDISCSNSRAIKVDVKPTTRWNSAETKRLSQFRCIGDGGFTEPPKRAVKLGGSAVVETGDVCMSGRCLSVGAWQTREKILRSFVS